MAEQKSAPEKKRIIFPLPATKDTKELRRAQVEQLGAPKSEVPAGIMQRGQVYTVSAGFAAFLVGNKGARYAGANGQPTDEKADPVAIKTRPGQAEWADWDRHRTGGELAEEFTAADVAAGDPPPPPPPPPPVTQEPPPAPPAPQQPATNDVGGDTPARTPRDRTARQ